MKICTQCKIEKEDNEFYKNGNRLQSCCKECHKQNIRESYKKKMEEINNYKQQIGCKKCGIKHFYLLDFHHKNPSEKDFTISDYSRTSLEKLMPEIEKCVLLCANCHREFHYLEKNKDITIEEYLK